MSESCLSKYTAVYRYSGICGIVYPTGIIFVQIYPWHSLTNNRSQNPTFNELRSHLGQHVEQHPEDYLHIKVSLSNTQSIVCEHALMNHLLTFISRSFSNLRIPRSVAANCTAFSGPPAHRGANVPQLHGSFVGVNCEVAH
jgi:hypothetical protein